MTNYQTQIITDGKNDTELDLFGEIQMAFKDSSIICNIDMSDIDHYNHHRHLNNAAYPRYFEKGRDDLATINGLDKETLLPGDIAFLVKNAYYDYITPVLENQEVEIRSRVVSVKRARVFLEQEMIYDGKAVSKCAAEYFFMDLKRERPIRPPSSVFQ